jgi:hypothetical protein
MLLRSGIAAPAHCKAHAVAGEHRVQCRRFQRAKKAATTAQQTHRERRVKYPGLASLTYVILLAWPAMLLSPAALTFGAETERSESALSARLENTLNKALESADSQRRAVIRMRPDAQAALQTVIERGAHRLAEDGASEDQVRLAESNLQRLAEAIIQNSEQVNTVVGTEVLVEGHSVRSALAICPLYPIC